MMSIYFIILSFVLVALGQDNLEEQTEFVRRNKLISCMNLVQIKLELDQENITRVVSESVVDSETTIKKITADMIFSCYNNITNEQAKKVSIISSAFQQLEQHEQLLTYDQNQFKSQETAKFTPELELFIKEISGEVNKLKQSEAEKQEKAPEEESFSQPPESWPILNKILACLCVIVVLLGVFYFLVQKIKQPSAYKQAKKKQKKKQKKD